MSGRLIDCFGASSSLFASSGVGTYPRLMIRRATKNTTTQTKPDPGRAGEVLFEAYSKTRNASHNIRLLARAHWDAHDLAIGFFRSRYLIAKGNASPTNQVRTKFPIRRGSMDVIGSTFVSAKRHSHFQLVTQNDQIGECELSPRVSGIDRARETDVDYVVQKSVLLKKVDSESIVGKVLSEMPVIQSHKGA